ncbi:uncharacterized protein CANTADRAFT_27244 [Suhomyces tanzawaensis NRRL Y-17324]|uniref:Uncharacterized protein n=1 Tax=Suhomyces tanzawaensis NRRL Y-17324 TaxID=984487 RepID=A0A1E4SD18_9ASCO|nr:uncharacterized protein CANTADRAFT_27244 [Suhomyces tanzawaensis NRRL Y-17324]ODV77417.1 hypothetical protein CANTADRAFT_27244 [Suhomyces tanzawaensis NRRL Y-17324]
MASELRRSDKDLKRELSSVKQPKKRRQKVPQNCHYTRAALRPMAVRLLPLHLVWTGVGGIFHTDRHQARDSLLR